MSTKPQPLSGAERVYLQGLIESLERQSEALHQQGQTVSGAELAMAVRYLRRLLPAGAAP
jgi:hypothetical protein